MNPKSLAIALLGLAACSDPAPTARVRLTPLGSGGAGATVASGGGGLVAGGNGGASSASSTAAAAGAAGTSPGGAAGSSGGGSAGSAGQTESRAGADGSAGAPVQEPTKSAGCGKADPPTGALSVTVGGNPAAYVVTLPQGYDPSTPVPLIFGFHGRNRSHVEFQTVDAANIQTELGSHAVMAYLKSQGGTGWEGSGELDLNIDFYETLHAKMLAEYCIDTNNVFAVGHSSGAHFTNILACRYGGELRGIGAVAGYHPESNCAEPVAAMIIHGATDTQVNNSLGESTRDYYLADNGCDSSSAPGNVSPCVTYQGCDAGLPVEWCEHTEPTYSNTNHGWPAFASEAIAEFFFGLP